MASTLNTKNAATFLGVSEGFLRKARISGKGPVYIKLSARKVIYRMGDLEGYLTANARLSVAEDTTCLRSKR